jgi:hypothetical protein
MGAGGAAPPQRSRPANFWVGRSLRPLRHRVGARRECGVENGATSNASPRVYLLGPDGNYEMLQLLGPELRYNVDVSTLVCGENSALYLSQMDPTGGRSQNNPAGANYGAGYCDAQCPVQTWIDGTLNTNSQGSCCNGWTSGRQMPTQPH